MRARRPLGAALAVGALWAASAAPAAATNDPLFERQWGLTQIGAPAAWAQSTGAGVVIGIVDTGVDATHPDLAGKIDAQATCLGGECREGSAPDVEGHGTSVASVAAAVTDNGIGMAGVAPGAHLVVAKALSDRGEGRVEDINNGIRWVVDHGARIVNLSLGDPDLVVVSRLGTPLKSAIEYAWSRGAIPVLASGNYDDSTELGSANYGTLDAVVVGATDPAGAVAGYSTALGNAKWGLVAPGGGGTDAASDVIAAVPGGRYAAVAGTSFAAPHVSGALALLLAQGLTPTAAIARLLATTNHAAACGSNCQGLLRVDEAVRPVAPATSAAPVASVVPPPATKAAKGSGREHREGRAPAIAVAVGLLVTVTVALALAARRPRRSRVSVADVLDDIRPSTRRAA